jgi:hypothetical protein
MGTIDNSTGRQVQGGASIPAHITNDAQTPIPIRPITTIITEYAQYSTIRTGEIAGSITAAILPAVASKLVKFKALLSNTGNVYLGWNASVTKPDGTTDSTSGLELAPGDDSGWMPIANLSLLFRICDNAGDDLTYMVLT